MQLEEGTSVLDNQVVDNNNDDPDDEESWVSEEVGENVQLIMDLPCGNHVDNLQPDEKVEDESHVARGISINSISLQNCFVEWLAVNTVLTAWEDHTVVLHVD